jgi:hypothetical protein
MIGPFFVIMLGEFAKNAITCEQLHKGGVPCHGLPVFHVKR